MRLFRKQTIFVEKTSNTQRLAVPGGRDETGRRYLRKAGRGMVVAVLGSLATSETSFIRGAAIRCGWCGGGPHAACRPASEQLRGGQQGVVVHRLSGIGRAAVVYVVRMGKLSTWERGTRVESGCTSYLGRCELCHSELGRSVNELRFRDCDIASSVPTEAPVPTVILTTYCRGRPSISGI